ncbi:hypothetical protein BU23DRAFT_601364 [Bimuria novae-zelandiae CBS 107.79]|uniref:F-box domain-containing protein n=1 Tax=Bimuria novae-zelandiae CBS 107.79 TaxID=1447943 RepID=A0A6A5UYP3_9PLEO|nr:hypothetical protein BU23DRAFT_601364 [Bimuria novae-zelandiae CBS 107.79]
MPASQPQPKRTFHILKTPTTTTSRARLRNLSMAISRRVRSIAAKHSVTRSLARRLDNLTNTPHLEDIYTAHLFTMAVPSQPLSRLLSLPAEIRLLIYSHVFTVDASAYCPRSTRLALLQTCRLIHGEAHVLALELLTFTINALTAPLALSARLSDLGARQMHLRHVVVTIPLPALRPLSAGGNPFVLASLLALEALEVRLVDTVGKWWKEDVRLFHLLVSSLCHVSLPSSSSTSTSEVDEEVDAVQRLIHASLREKYRRGVALRRWAWQPSHEDLYAMLDAMRTKKVVVRSVTATLYRAFAFFGLMQHGAWKLPVRGKGEGRYLVFHDEVVRQGSVLEFGQLDKGGRSGRV